MADTTASHMARASPLPAAAEQISTGDWVLLGRREAVSRRLFDFPSPLKVGSEAYIGQVSWRPACFACVL